MAEELSPKVLGQLLLMQSVVINLPDLNSIFSFVCKGLNDIPGIQKVRYSSLLSKHKEPSEIIYSITLGESSFGELILQVADFNKFKPYQEYLSNFVFVIGVILEERNQRKLNEEHNLLLEQRILERTYELSLEKENLAEWQRRFTSLMENVQLLSLMLNSEGNIIFCNNYLLRITGYTEEEIIGKNWFETFVPPTFNKQLNELFIKIMKGEATMGNFERELVAKNGEKLIVSWNNTLLYDTNHNIVGTASIGENITQRKFDEQLLKEKNEEIEAQNEEYMQLNDELFKAKEKAEESDRLKTSFLQNMSHEIRTPMNAIMGFADLLETNFNNKERLKRFADIIKQRGSDLLEIINDILDIAKIESGQLGIHYDTFELNELFGELSLFFKEYQKRIGKSSIAVKVDTSILQKRKNLVITDKIKLKQIFINLVTNAFKFTEKGYIEIACNFIDENNALFSVRDTGIGIPKDKQNIIFERFTQLKESSNLNHGGTGLGLPIVKGLLELLGGDISLDSEPQVGSKFTFRVPIKTIQTSMFTSKIIENYDYSHLKDRTILIVEDDYFNMEYLKEILSDMEINFLSAQTGKEAIEKALENQVDIVLMDIRLPDMSGYEAVREIKRKKKNICIIAQTAYASPDEKQKAIHEGCADYLSKPMKKEELLHLLTNYLS